MNGMTAFCVAALSLGAILYDVNVGNPARPAAVCDGLWVHSLERQPDGLWLGIRPGAPDVRDRKSVV